MAIIYVIVLICLASSCCNAQVSYNRACDCDYYVDGKCAYTLLLPTGGSDGTCQSDGEAYNELVNMVNTLSNNLTSLSLWSGEQARLLGQLQGTVIDQQTTIQNLQPSSNENNNDVDIGQIESQIDDQSSMIESLESDLENLQSNYEGMQESVTQLVSDVETITEANNDVTTRLNTIETAYNTQESVIANSVWLCNTRGRLIAEDESTMSGTVTASSSLSDTTTADDANIFSGSAWCADNSTEPNLFEWVQYDLGMERIVYGVMTKGRYDYSQWVTSYKVAYANALPDESASWTTVTDFLGEEQIFPGNTDQNSAQVNMLGNPITARYVRIIPLTGYADSNLCMRADLIGCVDV